MSDKRGQGKRRRQEAHQLKKLGATLKSALATLGADRLQVVLERIKRMELEPRVYVGDLSPDEKRVLVHLLHQDGNLKGVVTK